MRYVPTMTLTTTLTCNSVGEKTEDLCLCLFVMGGCVYGWGGGGMQREGLRMIKWRMENIDIVTISFVDFRTRKCNDVQAMLKKIEGQGHGFYW